MVATGPALRMMGDLLTSDEVKDAQATFWLTSLAFLPNPTKDMVAAVQVLLCMSVSQVTVNEWKAAGPCTHWNLLRQLKGRS